MASSTSLLRDVLTKLLAENGSVSITEAVEKAMEMYPKEFQADADRRVRAAARRDAKAILKSIAEEDGDDNPEPLQLGLPGLVPPNAFYDHLSDRYTGMDTATFPQVEGRLVELDENIKRARNRRRDWRMKVEYLRPRMPDETMVVGDTCDPEWAKKEGA